MKRIWVSLIAAGLLTIAAFAPVAGQESITLDLEEVDDSGISGSVRMVPNNGETEVEILITLGLEDDAVHPVHIHDGTCEDLGDVAYPLDDVVDGVSESTVDVDIMDLLEGEYAVNVHLSEDEMQVNVACADVIEAGVGGPAADEEDADAANGDDEATEADAADEEASEDEATDEEAADDEATDEEATDDEAAADDEEDVADDTDEVVEDEDAADDVQDEIVPAAGSIGGPSGDTVALMIALMAGSALCGGVLLRWQANRASAN